MYTLPPFMGEVLSEEMQLMKWVGIFQVGIFWVGIFWGGAIFFWGGESLMGGNFPGENFPRTHRNASIFNI